MRKPLILAVLALVMLFALTACKEPAADPFAVAEPEKVGDVYQITRPGHLLYMAQNPGHAYALAADIDMEGREWTPIDDFTGSLTGLIHADYNYTISNLTIRVMGNETDLGFFRVISGKVEDVIFSDIAIVGDGVLSGNFGVVAGHCKTELTDVDVTGSVLSLSVKDSQVGLLCGKLDEDASGSTVMGALNIRLESGKSYVGGAIGYAAGKVSSFDTRTALTVVGNDASGAAGGVLGYAGDPVSNLNYGGHLTVSGTDALAAGAVAGQLEAAMSDCYNCARSTAITGAATADPFYGAAGASGSKTDCYTRDLSNIEDTLSPEEYALRQQTVDHMYTICSIRWKPTVTMTYSDTCGGKTNNHAQTYEAGQVYFGLPYTHSAGSLEKFQHYLNADGTVVDSIPAAGWGEQLGNDCADAVYWSWAQVSSEISFVLTKDAICRGGTYPVGDYFPNSLVSTAEICQYNGAQVMYESYARIMPGDALLYAPGHIRMAAESSYVFRKADGTIDPNLSYVVCHEQGAGTGAKQEQMHSTCRTNHKYTFTQLFSGNYIPITIKAFENGAADPVEVSTTNKELSYDGVGKGIVKCNYRINGLTMRILDAKGNVVMDASIFPNTGAHMTQASLGGFRDDLKTLKLKSGKTYTYEVLVTVAGQQHMVQTYTFTA